MSLQAKSETSAPETIEAALPEGTVLHLWLKARHAGDEAKLFVAVDGNDIGEPSTRRTGEFEFFAVTLAKGGRAALSYDATTTALSVAYAFRPE
ncbi:glycoside hydrolase family 32 protein, partial [Rhizobium ruizarguesonis]